MQGTTRQLDLLREPKSTYELPAQAPLSIAGLFAGIAGVERGMARAGHKTVLLSEIDPAAQSVLNAHYPCVPLIPDVKDVPSIVNADLIAAGFPCQDLSQAGRTAGITGSKSS